MIKVHQNSQEFAMNRFSDDASLVNIDILRKALNHAEAEGSSHLLVTDHTMIFVKISERRDDSNQNEEQSDPFSS